MKKALPLSFAIVSCVSLSSLFLGASANANRSVNALLNHSSSCVWNHYSSLQPTFENNGIREYYICCQHHEILFEEPKEGEVRTAIEMDRAFANALPEEDSRVLLSFSRQVDRLVDRIQTVQKGWDLQSFSVFEELNGCFNIYNAIPENYRHLVSNFSDLLYLQSAFNDRFKLVLSADSFDIKGREYGLSYGKKSQGENENVKEVVTFNDITGSDTFWSYCGNSLSLTDYSSLEFYVKPSKDFSLEFRLKSNYSKVLSVPIKKDVYNHVSFPLESVSSFSEVGFAIWFGSSYSIDSLSFSSFYGKRREKKTHARLFDSAIDDFVCNDYVCSFIASRTFDEEGEDICKLSEISSETDWIWLKPSRSLGLSGYSAIYFKFKVSKDTTIEMRETYTGRASLLKRYNVQADVWTTITLEVNETNFPSNNLVNLGLGKYLEGGHPLGSAGDWFIGSVYGIPKNAPSGYEFVDDMLIPSFKKEGRFDITAYAVNKIEAANVTKILSGVKEAGFNKIIPLYNGRNYDLEDDFGTALKNYNSAILSSNKTKYKAETLALIDQYMDSIKENNALILSEAGKYGIDVVDFIGFIYDLDSILAAKGVSSLKESIYKEIMGEFLSKIDYANLSNYAGLFLKDEPNVKSDFSFYSDFATFYSETYSLPGSPFLNLLPLGDDGSEKNYKTYLDNYFANLYPSFGYASFDQYPLKTDGSVMDNHLKNLSDFSSRIKGSEAEGELKTFIHSTNEADETHGIAKIGNENDLLFQIYSAMAFGSQEIIYFVYSSNSSPQNGLVDFSNGDPTPLYDLSCLANDEILSFAPYYSYFDFEGVFVSGNASQFSSVSNPLSSLEGVASISSSFDLLAGEFKQGEDFAYLLMNYGNPLSGNVSSSVKLEFEAGINYALVFENGEKRLERVDKGGLELGISKGKATFVIPLSL